MTTIPAHRHGNPIGLVQIGPDLGFTWTLELPLSERAKVTVPVRMQTRDKGWTRYFFADFSALSARQVEILTANGAISPVANVEPASTDIIEVNAPDANAAAPSVKLPKLSRLASALTQGASCNTLAALHALEAFPFPAQSPRRGGSRPHYTRTASVAV